jgi:hypothetical protein
MQTMALDFAAIAAMHTVMWVLAKAQTLDFLSLAQLVSVPLQS